MKTILVTGAYGYVGTSVLDALSERGIDAIAFDISTPKSSPAVQSIECNLIADTDGALRLIERYPIDACIHLAWRNGFDHNNECHFADLSGHYAFLKGLLELGIPRVATMGSMHEVGYWEGPIKADTPCNPGSMYGIAKDALRRAFLLSADKSETNPLWLRGFYLYGNDARAQSIFGKLTRAAQAGEKKFPFTSGKNQYDFIHVDEFARQIVACMLDESASGIINCCTGEPQSLGGKIESFIAENNLDIQLDYGAYPDRPYDSPGVWGDATAIKKIMASYNR